MPPSSAAVKSAAAVVSRSKIVLHHILVSGKVQGVFYRKHTHKAAVERELTGWVRNLPDGRVEIMAEGPAAAVQSLEKWCYTGSPKSKVTGVEVIDETPTKRTLKVVQQQESKHPLPQDGSAGGSEPKQEIREVEAPAKRQYQTFEIRRWH